MGHAGPADGACGEDIVLVGRRHPHEAVRRHEDCPGKLGEFLLLVLPCRAVVAVEMGIFLQLRIAVGGKHLPMGIDIDPLPLGLFQHLLEVLQVVAGNQNRLAFLRPKGDVRGLGVPVGPRVPRVEELHGPDVRLPCLHGEPYPIVEGNVGPVDRREGLLDELVDVIIRLTKDPRVVRIG